ncbi:hypothetical protein LCGC14_1337080 [marine sediment metagenome]|uniref:Uncharacterized protein n=1 Tax=marine sediment metagenome TaxID=412755 RepID=A0A0F9NH31_9ZZZZ
MANKKADNFECRIQNKGGKPCRVVKGTQQGINAHIRHSMTHGHGNKKKDFQIKEDMWKKTTKAADNAVYVPVSQQREQIDGRTKAGRKSKSSLIEPQQTNGHQTLLIPAILKIRVNFAEVVIMPEEGAAPVIELKRKRAAK